MVPSFTAQLRSPIEYGSQTWDFWITTDSGGFPAPQWDKSRVYHCRLDASRIAKLRTFLEQARFKSVSVRQHTARPNWGEQDHTEEISYRQNSAVPF